MEHRFDQAITRRSGPDPRAPFSLTNARQERGGYVRRLREGTPLFDPLVSEPIIRWPSEPNGFLVQTQTRIGTTDLPGADRGRSFDAVKFGDRLYVAGERPTGGKSVPRTRLFPHDFAVNPFQLTWNAIEEPARVLSLDSIADFGVGRTPWTTTYDAGPFNFHTGYLVIPVSAKGEAGPWYHFEFARLARDVEVISVNFGTGVDAENFFPLGPRANFALSVNDEVDHVEVYKTLPFEGIGLGLYLFQPGIQCGERLAQQRALQSEGSAGASAIPVREDFYRLGEFEPQGPAGSRSVLIEDTITFITADYAAVLGLAESFLGQADGQLVIATETLDRARNLHSQLGDGEYRGFTANQLARDASLTLYGGVSYAAKQPSLYMRVTGNVPPTKNVALQYEYQIGSQTLYGPPLYIEDIDSGEGTIGGKVAHQGETALNIFARHTGTGEYRLYKRYTPERGRYVRRSEEGDPSAYLFFAGADGDLDTSRGIYPETPYLEQLDVVLESASNRPWELTESGFPLPDGRDLLLLSPVTVQDEKAVQRQNLISATDRSVYVHRRTDAGYATDTVLPTHGVMVTPDGRPVFAQCSDFAAIAGTDGSLHFITPGGDVEDVDDDVEGLLGHICGLAFDANDEVLYVLSDTGLWGYLLQRDHVGFRLQYAYPYGDPSDPPEGVFCSSVWYDDTTRKVMIGLHDTDGDKTAITPVRLDEGGDALPASITSQRYAEGVSTYVMAIKFDFDAGIAEEADLPGTLSVEHAVRNPRIKQFDGSAENGDAVGTDFQAAPNRLRYPQALRGPGHQFRISGFESFRTMSVEFATRQ